MVPERLRTKESEIRRAIARRQYDGLPRKLEDLRRIAAENVAGLPASDPFRLEIVGRMLATIEWARLMLATQRQILSDDLELLPNVGRYLERADGRTPGVCLDL